MGEQKTRILVVEHDLECVALLRRAFRDEADRFAIEAVSGLDEARAYLSERLPGLVIGDWLLPDGRVVELLSDRDGEPEFPLVVLVAPGDEQVGVESIETGALDYVVKSEAGLSDLPHVVERVLREWCQRVDLGRTKQELAHLKAFHADVLHSMSEGVVLSDVEGEIVFCNPAAAALLGTDCETLKGQPWPLFLPLAGSPVVTPEVRQQPDCCEQELVRQDGRHISVLLNTIPRFQDARFVGNLFVFADITKRKWAEDAKAKLLAQLFETQRLEVIGMLAGGIAHEFNNLLTTIRGYAEFLLSALEADDPLHRDVGEIKKAGDRASVLVQQLLALGRRQVLQQKVFDLNELIAGMSRMLRHLVGEQIEIDLLFGPDLALLEADPGKIEQVLLCLGDYARSAMPWGGKLTIRTENVVLGPQECAVIPESRPGRFVCLSVSDTGKGTAKRLLHRIFEPFFEEKEKGEGLGLSVAYGIIRQHHGWINVYSEPEQGTIFKVYLASLSVEEVEFATLEKALPDEVQGNGERILVVENDDPVREFAARVLGENGYVVFTAANGQEGVELFAQENGGFDLIFSDMFLPDQNGLEIVEQFSADHPNVRVLLCSGYADGQSRWPTISQKGFLFIQKPYTQLALLQAVRQVLDGIVFE